MVGQKIRIFGAGVRGQVIADLLAWRFSDAYRLDGFYDDKPAPDGRGPGGAPILGSVARGLEELPSSSGVAAFFALGTYRSWRNCELMQALQHQHVTIATLVSPAAFVSPSASIGPGAFVMDGVFIGAHARIGALFGANAGSVVEHHAWIGDNVLLGSSVAIAGSAKVNNHCFIGTNATILPRVEIGAGVLVGSGSVVTRDLPPGVVALGAPARPHRPVGDADEVPSPERIHALARPASESPQPAGTGPRD
jgi:sugar O-acyltransferase (sialic acid O-acetyltransferase NeuD family)